MARQRKQENDASFENNLHRLEQIVEILEQGEVPLEESLKMYEEGVLLSRKCMEILSHAERKLKTLSKDIPDSVVPDDELTGPE